ncbi:MULTISPECIES: ABC transporter permease DevC [Cyanophyceae]|uniref:ABC transporter permease DevC n=1 Tax=Cyanophyceae TaxID=3028117 RepID=UPI0016858FF2|nr:MULTISPECIES: ABC transporter permease DevC [Cyanophyceae]MBD1918061.1 FtsX-like permease family protein [Phormidium sp. FACHB-77]MBD2030094.1 FtsX-like permease family protein [Phormidium sp. FACHB-322]MBD2051535.1 FtsX-like permease family protein [Leptolyngbya sp. FACHB-60]
MKFPSLPRIPLAWYNLRHDRPRLLVAVAGVTFAVLLMFMNLGFLGALVSTTTNFYDQFNGDIFLISPQSLEISSTKAFPRERLYQAAGIEGVQQVMPLYAEYALWKNPETSLSRAMFVYAFNPSDPVFLMPELDTLEERQALQQPNAAFIDRRSRPEFGPQTVGLETEADRRRITIAGQYDLGGGFAADGTLIMSDQNFRRYFSPRPLDQINLGLVLLEPDADTERVKAALQAQLPADVEVYTKPEIIAKESRFWIQTTSIGFIFGLGVVVSFVVGTVIVYQILYTDIRDHLREYATLKAIGYSGGYLFKTVLQEALLLALMGYVPGLILALGLYQLAYNATAGTLPMQMTVFRVIFVFSLTVLMCALSGLISVRKAVTADPAEVFA